MFRRSTHSSAFRVDTPFKYIDAARQTVAVKSDEAGEVVAGRLLRSGRQLRQLRDERV